jgi:hypothetical protein
MFIICSGVSFIKFFIMYYYVSSINKIKSCFINLSFKVCRMLTSLFVREKEHFGIWALLTTDNHRRYRTYGFDSLLLHIYMLTSFIDVSYKD